MRLELLQAGRGGAALLVLMAHSELAATSYFGTPFTQGQLLFGRAGVDFFFVLSGFIMWWVHAKDMNVPGTVGMYAQKRFLRIYPPYWVALALVLPVFFLLPGSGTGHEKEPLTILGAIALAPLPHDQILNVAWTLCYEVVFYIVFGIMLARPAIGIGLMSAWVLASLFSFVQTPYPLSFFFAPYGVHFALGIGVAALVRHAPVRQAWLLAIAGMIAFLGVAQVEKSLGDIWAAWAYGLSSAVIITGLASADLRAAKPIPAALSLLGSASYSIYLIHYPIVVMGCKVLSMVFPGASASIMLPTVIAMGAIGGIAFYFLVEKPLFKHRFALIPKFGKSA